MDIRAYPVQVLKDADRAIAGYKPELEKLLNGGYPEWAAFANGIHGDNEATVWLLKNGFGEMGVLVNGFNDEPAALSWLRRHSDAFYYAFCQATKKEPEAIAYLEKTGQYGFIILAETIRKAMRLRIKKETFWYKIDW